MKAIGYLLIATGSIFGVAGVALIFTIIGILPGIGMIAIAGLLLVYGVAAARGEKIRGALSRRREIGSRN